MNNSTSLEDQGFEDQEEDALSLCDFPLNSGEPERNAHHRRRTSSQPSDSFEFSNDLSSDSLSHAEDIIHCGKLMPYKQAPISPSEDYDSSKFPRRFCDSLPARSNNYGSARLTRSSRSLDKKQLHRNSSLVMKSEASSKGWKPRWYDLTFGLVKFPPEMDLRDMKNRQVRRSMVTAADGGDGNRRSSWSHDFLKVLSCKNNPGSVAVTASIRLVPQL